MLYSDTPPYKVNEYSLPNQSSSSTLNGESTNAIVELKNKNGKPFCWSNHS